MGFSCVVVVVVCSCLKPNEKPNFSCNMCKNKKRRVSTSFLLKLFSNIQFFDNLTISVDIFLFKIIKQASSFTY